MPVHHIDDPADPRLAPYAGMRDSRLRRSPAELGGLLVTEGTLVIARAIECGYPVVSALSYPSALDQVLETVPATVPVYVADPALVARVTGYPEHRGALGLHQRRPPTPLGDLLAAATRLVVLERASNPTNLGVVMRAAAGLGFDGALLSPGSTDPLYRRALRASMGEALRLPWATLEPWPDGLLSLRARGLTVVALSPGAGSVDLRELAGSVERVALLVGSEGHGLTPGALALAERTVGIPMTRGVDSLNLAVAAGIAMWAFAGG